MLKIAVFVLALAAACCALTFSEWQTQYGKTFTGTDAVIRAQIFDYNDRFIWWFNTQNFTYTLAHNEFSHMTHSEFRRVYLPAAMTPKRTGKAFAAAAAAPPLPDSVDWRTKNIVTEVKNQGQCGSCWSFSTTGSLEGQHALKTGNLVSLSEQNLVDCSGPEGNQGCNGGLMDDAFDYILKNNGIDTEKSYPYTARDGTCKFSATNVGATVTGHVDVTKDSESDLQTAVATVGPISVAIDAGDASFQFYKKGVYDPLFCSATKLDHGVLAVGYGTESGTDYWLVKNSWGASWGMDGYINMARNKGNKCGIASAASYPTV